MWILAAGLALFLGVHSIRYLAGDWRAAQVQRLGQRRWKALYGLASLAGFALVVWGFASARASVPVLWTPPLWTHHVAALLTLLAFVLLAASFVPGNHIKAAIGHPMIAAVKTWAFAHLCANGSAADVLLFGSFLAWSIFAFAASRRRDRREGIRYAPGRIGADAGAVIAGVLAWALFAGFAHLWLIGVRPFP